MKCDDRKLIVGEFSFEDITTHLTPAGGERQSERVRSSAASTFLKGALHRLRGTDGCVYVCVSQ